MKNSTIIFYELHPINAPFALIVSIFFQVAYWRSSFLPKWLCRNFEQIYQHGSFTQGEWATKSAPIFFDLKKKFPRERYSKRVFFRYDGNTVDVTNAAMQRIIAKYERVKHLHLLVDYWLIRQPKHTKFFIVDFLENKNLEDVVLSARDKKYPEIFLLNTYLDMLWDLLVNIMQTGRQIRNYFSPAVSPQHNYTKGKIKLYWYCLSWTEIASKKDSLDITTIVRKGVTNPSGSIFILSKIPENKQKIWLSKNNIKWVYQKDVRKFTYKRKSLIDVFQLLRVLVGFGVFSGERSLIRQVKPLLISHSMLFSHFLETGASTLVTGQSNGTHENPIVDIARALHKKTIWWSYSGQGAKSFPSLKLPKYQYEQIEEAITLSEEKCVWDKLDKDTLLVRNLIPMHENQTKLTITGPLMSGDPEWIKLIPGDARQKYSNFYGNKACKLWITIFDLPVFEDNLNIMHRWPVGLITKDIEQNFFKDISLLLGKYKNIGVIYKPKRRVAEKFFESDAKNKLFSKDNPLFLSGRIVKLPYNIDPYIAMSIGDVAIAMPYTSALLASISFKRDGIYYDPLANLGSAYPELVNSITLNSFEQLCDRVESWLMGENFINNNALEVLKYKGDPVTSFTSIL